MTLGTALPALQRDRDVDVTVLVDSEVLKGLERERAALRDPDLRTTIRRRLDSAGFRLAFLQREDLLWSPPLRERTCLHAQISLEGWDALTSQADRLDIDRSTLLTGLLSDDLFASPLMYHEAEFRPSGYLRTERGKGRVYGMTFEVAGFQYAFLKMLAGSHLSPTQVFGMSVTSLAEQIARDGAATGLRLPREAVQMALEIAAGRRGGPSSPAPR